MTITKPIIKAGVIGHPIAHSLSPMLHGYWLDKYNIAGSYQRFNIAPEDLAANVTKLIDQGLAGFNVTAPHKQAIMEFCDHIDSDARLAGALNTIVVGEDRKISGFNTDIVGFRENLVAHPQFSHHPRDHAIIVGAGGAARGVIIALKQLGFSKIGIVNRTIARAQAIAGQFDECDALDNARISLGSCDCLVNTTSLGMKGEMPDVALEKLPAHCLVSDCVYTPLMTPLLTRAKAHNLDIQDGLGMLLHQAVDGFEAWFQHRPQVDVGLRNLLLRELQARA